MPETPSRAPVVLPLDASRVAEIVEWMQGTYPGWEGFSDPSFVADELDYKRRAVAQAAQLLAEPEVRHLAAAGQGEELVRRLEVLAHATNLLFLGVPRQGDLSLLYQEGFAPDAFAAAFADLLYGEGDGPERLGRYLAWVEAAGLPNKWTFPTYFLFLCFPQSEIFVKPETTTTFVRLIGIDESFRGAPTVDKYRLVRQIAHRLRQLLPGGDEVDMVAIQSVIWVTAQAATRRVPPSVVDPPPAPVPATGAPFTAETFELLAALARTPRKETYLERKAAFLDRLEQPFQKLFSTVTHHLPAPILEAMETETGLFSRILKNDYGRGGAWDFYWGAFYPKGGKRTRGAQLFLWINAERVEYGFAFGEYTSGEKGRFLAHAQQHGEQLAALLDHHLPLGERFFAQRSGSLTDRIAEESDRARSWAELMKVTETAHLWTAAVLTRSEVLARPAVVLIEEIARAFTHLFPLVLMAISDDPLAAIGGYLELDDGEEPPLAEPYPLSRLVAETGLAEAELARWLRAIERKQQAILYGPPGTGKTHAAERLARHLVGGTAGFWELLQLHPAYAYEDFVQGLRPHEVDGALTYRVVDGRFKDFCKRAARRGGAPCVLILDEINRANLARVFGELMYLLEYRDKKLPLATGGELAIPANVRILGTMNTADRSIALVDHALRRRFAFLPLWPSFDVLRRFHQGRELLLSLSGLIAVLGRLNREIADPHYEVGITFFLRDRLGEEVEDIWRMEIEPYLAEYFFDQPDKAAAFGWAQVGEEILGAGR